MIFRGSRCFIVLALSAGVLCWPEASLADDQPAGERGLEIDSTEPPEPGPEASQAESPAIPAPPGLQIPDVPPGYDREQALSRAYIRRVEVLGNTVLPAATVATIVGAYEQRDLTFEQLEALRLELTRAYIQAGYVNSGVLLPDQDVTDGVLRLQVVEGRLQAIAVSGNEHLSESYIERRLLPAADQPFNVRDLETSLRLMQQWPMVAQVNAEVLPGPVRGVGIVDLRVRENPPRTLSLTYDNHRSPSVGEHEGVLSLVDRSITGNADYLYGSYSYADGLDDYSFGYGLPLTAKDLTAEAYFSQGTSDIVEQPFESLDIVSETRTWGVKFFRPVVRELSQTLTLGVLLEHSRTTSTLAGEPFSFSAGDQDGRNRVTAVRLVGDWAWRGETDAVVVRGTVSRGVEWLDATDNSGCPSLPLPPGIACPGNLPESDFLSGLLQAEYAHRLPVGGLQVVARTTAQLTSDPLLSAEKLAVGGARTVRGYRENLLVRDEAVVASLELRVPVLASELGQSRIGLTVVPFLDYGLAVDKPIDWPGLDDPETDHLTSVGAGLLWDHWAWLRAELYYGYALRDVDAGDSLQEDGFHGLVSLRWSF